MNIYGSIVSNSLLKKFPSGYPTNVPLTNFVANCVDLEGVLACAGLFCPTFIEINNVIYRKDGADESFKPYEGDGKDKKTLEMTNNNFCLSEFFLMAANEASESVELMFKFSIVLEYFWRQRLKELFPEKKFEFIHSENGLFDEDGFCITFYEVE
ncbi:hypothetical protein I4902_14960 [Proteus alimentorum]|uniref:Uncharacterized protein n=1 Tax=Proteus alimentorum TaxID=1973495 RepID=A0ABS0IX16_9GAMM|nr:hypothetical protein [Proteus alimentorum]MBG2876505.1 hypothetical protein [Proteus alimentorum]MBG2880560.1 hypothetical protein [Proteus alimentorum]